MKQLQSYIKESIDESNIFYMLSSWFKNSAQDESDFTKVINQCIDNKTTDETNLKTYISGTFLDTQLEKFVAYLNNEINILNNCENSLYNLKKIVEFIISNKSIQNKWKRVV